MGGTFSHNTMIGQGGINVKGFSEIFLTKFSGVAIGRGGDTADWVLIW